MMLLYIAGDSPHPQVLLITLQEVIRRRTVRSLTPTWFAIEFTTAALAARVCLVIPALVMVLFFLN